MKLPELEELYRRYRMDLYRYLCFLTHDPVQAEDLLSETFVRVIKRLPTFRGECEVKTWLFGIARNIWLESLRRRRLQVCWVGGAFLVIFLPWFIWRWHYYDSFLPNTKAFALAAKSGERSSKTSKRTRQRCLMRIVLQAS